MTVIVGRIGRPWDLTDRRFPAAGEAGLLVRLLSKEVLQPDCDPLRLSTNTGGQHRPRCQQIAQCLGRFLRQLFGEHPSLVIPTPGTGDPLTRSVGWLSDLLATYAIAIGLVESTAMGVFIARISKCRTTGQFALESLEVVR